jgi:hypothetical protein
MALVWSFFHEFRILLSTLLSLLLFYAVGMFDSLLKEYFVTIFSLKLKLKVKISHIELNLFQGQCIFHNAIIYHPPQSVDPRWKSEILLSAKQVVCTFDPILSLFGYWKFWFFENKKFALFKTISVHSIDLFVEGYEEKIKEDQQMGQGGQQGKSGQQNKLLLNLKLIGGEQKNTRRLRKPTYLETKVLERHEKRKKRQQLAQARAEAAAQSIRSRSGSVAGGTGGNKGE